ncbi:GH25 family lysozyme [Saxibacter everestensis]|uniref:GH25 family lysozyme n=1 Tax=Saxibacter everestensis TaxID=2909229 RepID=A0ABY8QSA3_9MICO|nr:GH25 family lysozyme [Brevibacteriaceae bacterium ZFBP1038]
MAVLHGADVSHWQGAINWSKVDPDFIIFKATEGTSYTDPTYAANMAAARERDLLVGMYHFAKGGNAVQEADHFLSRAGHRAGELMALDWEIDHRDPDGWAAEWLRRVAAKTGVVPLIYMNTSTLKARSWTKVRRTGAGLWVARPGSSDPGTGPWPVRALWQYSFKGSTPGIAGDVDLNYFAGDQSAWKRYGGGGTGSTPPPDTKAAPKFPLPAGSYFGPKDGPSTSVSGYYSHNSDLQRWQTQVRSRGWAIAVDGLYGDQTASVARQFQEEKGLTIDGLVGPETWTAAWTSKVTP